MSFVPENIFFYPEKGKRIFLKDGETEEPYKTGTYCD